MSMRRRLYEPAHLGPMTEWTYVTVTAAFVTGSFLRAADAFWQRASACCEMMRLARGLKPTSFLRALAGLVLSSLPAACDTPTQPSPSPSEPSPASVVEGALSGTYSLTIAASSRCRSELPNELQTRTYTATIEQAADDSLMVHVDYPSGWSWGQPDRFPGRLGATNEVIFELGVEEWWLAGGEFLAYGTTRVTIVEERLSGFLDGYMKAIVINEDGRGNRVVTCTAPDHAVLFSRRPR